MVLLQSTLKVVHPKVIENIYLKNLQGDMVATQFLPERGINFPTFTFRRYGELGGVTPESAEGSFTRVSSTEYSEEVAKCIEYREGELISEQAIKFFGVDGHGRNLQVDAAEHLSDRLVLRQERNTVLALQNNASNVIDLALGSGTAWNEPNADPLDDMTEGRRLIRKDGHTVPDIQMMNSDTEADLLQTAALKQWQLSGPISQNPLMSGSLEGVRLRGLNTVVTDAFFLAEERTAAADEVRNFLLDNVVIIFRSGGQLGNTYVAEPFTSRTFVIEDNRSMKLMIWKTMTPVIFRPQYICNINNVRTDES